MAIVAATGGTVKSFGADPLRMYGLSGESVEAASLADTMAKTVRGSASDAAAASKNSALNAAFHTFGDTWGDSCGHLARRAHSWSISLVDAANDAARADDQADHEQRSAVRQSSDSSRIIRRNLTAD